MAQEILSKVCCSSSRIEQDYTAKGSFIEIDGMKTYSNGPSTATAAIIIIYDAFGFGPQLYQGADILANDYGLQVFMPDFYRGEGIDLSWFPPDTEEKQRLVKKFKDGPGQIAPAVVIVSKVIDEIKNTYGGKFNKFFAVGFCWGAKVAYLSSQESTPLSAVAGCHPSFVEPHDATKITIPICILNSKGEDAEVASQFESNLAVEKHVETFGDQVHGWMAGRADLSDPRVREEFGRGYQTVGEFFRKRL